MTRHGSQSQTRWLWRLASLVCLMTLIIAPILEFRGCQVHAETRALAQPSLSDVASLAFILSSLKSALGILVVSALAPGLGLGVIAMLHRLRLSDVATAMAVWTFSVGGLLALFWSWTRIPG